MSDDREWELNDSEDHDVTTDESQSVTDPEVHQDKTDTDESGKRRAEGSTTAPCASARRA